ncbi:hypothetical protein [uncultured Lacticaseibacillus sp.]|uniref:hypothetical protein n=1 Tax=uncultured Lacticaseibacillus sp. TaxID=2775882 RepID=UPI00259505B4|nr:hypothetical protein [uncultured Lacticaseibacillus sp.]
MATEFKVVNNIIRIKGLSKSFDYLIDQVLSRDGLIFVRLQIPMNIQITPRIAANLIALNERLEVAWVVNWCGISDEFPAFEALPLEIMSLNDDGNLEASDFMGRRYRISMDTGTAAIIGAVK